MTRCSGLGASVGILTRRTLRPCHADWPGYCIQLGSSLSMAFPTTSALGCGRAVSSYWIAECQRKPAVVAPMRSVSPEAHLFQILERVSIAHGWKCYPWAINLSLSPLASLFKLLPLFIQLLDSCGSLAFLGFDLIFSLRPLLADLFQRDYDPLGFRPDMGRNGIENAENGICFGLADG